MPRYNPDGTVEMKFQGEEYQYPAPTGSRPFARGTGRREEKPVATPAKKVEVKAVPPLKPARPKAEPKPKPASKRELNRVRDARIVALIKGGATGQEAGDAVGLCKQQALHIFRRDCPGFALPRSGRRASQVGNLYGDWEVLEDSRHYRQPDGSMAPGRATAGAGAAYLKCQCSQNHIQFISSSRLLGGKLPRCSTCAAMPRPRPTVPATPKPMTHTGPLTPAEQALARSLAPPAK